MVMPQCVYCGKKIKIGVREKARNGRYYCNTDHAAKNRLMLERFTYAKN